MDEESPAPLPPAEESTEAGVEPTTEQGFESSEFAPEHDDDPDFVCDCGENVRSACVDEPFYKEQEGKRYCVLHYSGKEKSADFKEAVQRKLDNNDFDFRGVWFPNELDFSYFELSEYADFSFAQFSADANFHGDTFNEAVNFDAATFNAAASFTNVTFSKHAYFGHVTFRAGADFGYARFREYVIFKHTKFNADADFSFATFSEEGFFDNALFNDSVKFFGYTDHGFLDDETRLKERALGENPSLSFQYARIEKPDRATFHTAALRPHWFVNVDPRNFVFTDVDWDWEAITIKGEINSLIQRRAQPEFSSPHRLLAIACRQLAENAETNNRYEEASRFRYWAMDLARHYKWAGWRFWKTDWLHMIYWAVSGYGERILRALGWLVAVWIVFALLYTRVGLTQQTPRPSNENPAAATSEDTTGQPLEIQRSLTYSLAVMSLQRPEPRPLTNWAHALVTLEMILGPVQAALLVLAIRRKFMR